jgi:hypothetical protein
MIFEKPRMVSGVGYLFGALYHVVDTFLANLLHLSNTHGYLVMSLALFDVF